MLCTKAKVAKGGGGVFAGHYGTRVADLQNSKVWEIPHSSLLESYTILKHSKVCTVIQASSMRTSTDYNS